MQTVARIVDVKSSRCCNSGISVMRAAHEHGVPRQTLTSPHLCGSKSPSFSTGSMVHTPRLHTPSPVTTSVTPGTPSLVWIEVTLSQYWFCGLYTWIEHVFPCFQFSCFNTIITLLYSSSEISRIN